MSIISDFDDSKLLVFANDIRTRYNKLRQNFYNTSVQYYRQSISNRYYKEEDLRKMLDELEMLKEQYIEVRNALNSRGLAQYALDRGWEKKMNNLYVKTE